MFPVILALNADQAETGYMFDVDYMVISRPTQATWRDSDSTQNPPQASALTEWQNDIHKYFVTLPFSLFIYSAVWTWESGA